MQYLYFARLTKENLHHVYNKIYLQKICKRIIIKLRQNKLKIGLGATVIWDIADHASIMSSAEKTARDFVNGTMHIITQMIAANIMRKAQVLALDGAF